MSTLKVWPAGFAKADDPSDLKSTLYNVLRHTQRGRISRASTALGKLFEFHKKDTTFPDRLVAQIGTMVDEHSRPKGSVQGEGLERFVLLSLDHLRAGKHIKQAVVCAESYLAVYPASEPVGIIHARCLMLDARPREALAALDAFYAQQGGSIELCKAALSIAEDCHETDWIMPWVDRIFQKDPTDVWAVCKLSAHLDSVKKLELIRPHLKNTQLDKSVDPFTTFLICSTMIDIGEHDLAEETLNALAKQRPESLRCLGTRLANDLSTSNLDRAVQTGRKVMRSRDTSPDRYFLYQDLIAALNADPAAAQSHAADLAEFEDAYKKRCAAPMDASKTHWIDRNRMVLGEIRNTQEARYLRRQQPMTISVICPVHRRTDVPNLVAQIAHQTWRNVEVVFAINGGRVTAEDISSAWASSHLSDMRCQIVDCHDLSGISVILNRAIGASSGQFVARMDADDLYMPDYLSDMITTMQYFRADMSGKRPNFVFFEDRNSLAVSNDQNTYDELEIGHLHFMTGGTIFFRRGLFETVRFNEGLVTAEDTDFVRKAVSNGFNVRLADPFNYLYIRHGTPGVHTWSPPEAFLYMVSSLIHLGDKSAIEKLVWY
ncbi:MAG: glycosyltransferase [Pseudomonadota bacterium]